MSNLYYGETYAPLRYFLRLSILLVLPLGGMVLAGGGALVASESLIFPILLLIFFCPFVGFSVPALLTQMERDYALPNMNVALRSIMVVFYLAFSPRSTVRKEYIVALVLWLFILASNLTVFSTLGYLLTNWQ